MPPLKYTIDRWEKERQERVENERLFDISEQAGQLILKKRRGPVLSRAIPASVFAAIWCLMSWHMYQDAANRNGWFILLFWMFGAFCTVPSIREGWRVWKGDTWIIDGKRGRLEHNGALSGNLSQMRCIRAWQETDAEDGKFSRLAIVPEKGKEIMLADHGNTRENWQELTHLARLISEETQVPVEIQT